jgi:voltage-gated potassium channel
VVLQQAAHLFSTRDRIELPGISNETNDSQRHEYSMSDTKETTTKPVTRKGGTVTFRDQLRHLYLGEIRTAQHFRYGLLVFDAVTIAFIIGTSFMPRATWLEWLDVIFGLVILADFSARLFVSPRPAREFTHLATWADMVAIVSFLAPVVGEGLGFLRILRTLRLLHTYQLTARLRADSLFFRRNEEVISAVLKLAVFLFIMTGVVYQTQHWRNPAIANYVDALYFTVTALTTTGFGDITLVGTWGRVISVTIMIFGVTLFLRLLQALVRPHKVRYACPTCGLQRHEVDAVHCKACGTLLNIPDEGQF